MPSYQDHFLRVAWQREGEDRAVVFKVSGKDFTPLLVELERVTGESVGDRVPEQDSQEGIYGAAITHIEAFDRKVAASVLSDG
jgi:hypothetical protein